MGGWRKLVCGVWGGIGGGVPALCYPDTYGPRPRRIGLGAHSLTGEAGVSKRAASNHLLRTESARNLQCGAVWLSCFLYRIRVPPKAVNIPCDPWR